MDRALRPATAKVRVCFPAKPELWALRDDTKNVGVAD